MTNENTQIDQALAHELATIKYPSKKAIHTAVRQVMHDMGVTKHLVREEVEKVWKEQLQDLVGKTVREISRYKTSTLEQLITTHIRATIQAEIRRIIDTQYEIIIQPKKTQ